MSGAEIKIIVRNAVIVDRRVPLFTLEEVAEASGSPPLFVARLAEHGVVEPERREAEPLFSYDSIVKVRKALRLRRDFGLNVEAVALVMDLLDRLEHLERR